MCLEECHKVSPVLAEQNGRVGALCPEMIKDCSSGMGGVDIFDQKTAAYKLNCKSSGGCYYLRYVFDLMDISVVNLHKICRGLYPNGIELLHLKIFSR